MATFELLIFFYKIFLIYFFNFIMFNLFVYLLTLFLMLSDAGRASKLARELEEAD